MSFFAKLKSEIASLWKKAPAEEIAVASAVNYVVPIVETLDEIITPELAPVLNPILDKIKVGLTALKVTIQDSGSSPNFASIVASIKANFSALLSASQVKDPAVLQKIQDVATLVVGELDAFSVTAS